MAIKNKIVASAKQSGEDDENFGDITSLKAQVHKYETEIQEANKAVNAWMVENDELKKEKASAIERLEIANRLSEEYKELVVQMQTKLQQLLDGEIDAKEVLTDDPVVASLAERIYGINVEKLD